jgi:hypothetical protein
LTFQIYYVRFPIAQEEAVGAKTVTVVEIDGQQIGLEGVTQANVSLGRVSTGGVVGSLCQDASASSVEEVTVVAVTGRVTGQV